MGITLNIFAIIACAIGSMVLGFLWYGPLFGKQWMRLMKLTPKTLKKQQKGMGAVYGLQFIASIVVALIISGFVDLTSTTTAWQGALIGFLGWIGFAATTGFSSVLFENKPIGLFLLDAGHQLILMSAMGAILAIWV